MSKVQMLRVFVNQRLSAAAEEIFELFERTILEYEEKLCGSKENQHKQIETVYNPEADAQQLFVRKEEVLHEQQKRSSSLEAPQIKEEQEELLSGRQGEQLLGLEEADISTFIFTPVPVKGEENREKPQSSQLNEKQTEVDGKTEHLMTEDDGEDWGWSETDKDFNPDDHLQPVTDGETSHTESETDNSNDWEDTKKSQSGLDPLQNKEGYNNAKTSSCFSDCDTYPDQKTQLQNCKDVRVGEERFGGSVCGESLDIEKNVSADGIRLTKRKGVSCCFCQKKFTKPAGLVRHMRIHTGEKPFSCSVCGKSFTQKSHLYQHEKIHTEEKYFSCSICNARFHWKTNLVVHMRLHTGERPFCCSDCGRSFTQKSSLDRHLKVHTGEKPFSCSVCKASFWRKTPLVVHMRIHTGEKPFSCSVCGKRFSQRRGLTRHAVAHAEEKPLGFNVCD